MAIKKNEHSYEVTDDFQAWWETQSEEPHKATIEKLAAWRAWEERGRRQREELHPKQTDLLQ